VYYYPYPPHHHFHAGFFFGVTTAFVVGWDTHHVHVHHHRHVGHPFYGYRYHEPFYVRRSINVNFVLVERNTYVWHPRHRHGARPERITVIRERGGIDRRDVRRYTARTTRAAEARPVARSAERAAATRSPSQRTVSRSAEGRAAGQTGRAGTVRGTERRTPTARGTDGGAPRGEARRSPRSGDDRASRTSSAELSRTVRERLR